MRTSPHNHTGGRRCSWALASALAIALLATSCGGSSEPAASVEAIEPASDVGQTETSVVADDNAIADETTADESMADESTGDAMADESTDDAMADETMADETDDDAMADEPVADDVSDEPIADDTADDTDSPDTETAAEPTAAVPAESAVVAVSLPDVPVVDLLNGQTSSLTNRAEAGPTLVWFWAPF